MYNFISNNKLSYCKLLDRKSVDYNNELNKIINKVSNEDNLPNITIEKKDNGKDIKADVTDNNFFKKTIYKINNYEFNKKEFDRTMSKLLHIKNKK